MEGLTVMVLGGTTIPRIVSPMVDWGGGGGGGSSIRYHIRSYQALTFINMIL